MVEAMIEKITIDKQEFFPKNCSLKKRILTHYAHKILFLFLCSADCNPVNVSTGIMTDARTNYGNCCLFGRFG